jgi:DNA-binding MarR family transcriptional regulator
VPKSPANPQLDGLVDAWDEFLVATRRARSRVNARQRRGSLTLSQLQVAAPLLDQPEGLPVGRLAEAAGIAGPSATGVLDTLERDGIIERSRHGCDRRSVTIMLTQEGRRKVRAKRRAIEADRRRFFAALNKDECEEMARALRALAQMMGEESLV